MIVSRPVLALAILCTLFAPQAEAQPSDIMGMVRADRWNEAALAASRATDPVAAKLVRWFRLLSPRGGSAAEISGFMNDSPDWPLQATLARRRDEALVIEPDDAVAGGLCAPLPQSSPALQRCAEALSRLNLTDAATTAARNAWTAAHADLAWESAFLARWSAVLRPEEQWQRFERLAATSDLAATQRQIARLDDNMRRIAEVRLALRRDDPTAGALLATLSAEQKGDPGLVLEQARALRRAGQDDAALALWLSQGNRIEARAAAERQGAFWDERNLLARRRLRSSDAAGAYALVSGNGFTGGEPRIDAEFLAGFIALRRLQDPARAALHFTTLASLSHAAITQGRAEYWLGRATGDPSHYLAASAVPNTYYGQLAVLALGEGPTGLAVRITAQRDPVADPGRVLDLAGRELARAAALLNAWGEPRRARPFLMRLFETAPDAPDRALAARLAVGFGMPETAVAIARRAGTAGLILLDTGWPLAGDMPDVVDPALALGVIRQESSFDTMVVSPVGARGLMQLMPATALQVARKLGMGAATGGAALTGDPAMNMRLGTAYLRDLLDQFNNAVPLAIAAYNAGPSRVRDWQSVNGDPLAGGVDMIDWIELIPFSETRNYVQRVIENTVIYQARGTARGSQVATAAPVQPHPLSAWLH
jgi:soluble lytic murein transglycosylase